MEPSEATVDPEVGRLLDNMESSHAAYHRRWLETNTVTPEAPEWPEIVKALSWAYSNRTNTELLELAGNVLFQHFPGLLTFATCLKFLERDEFRHSARVRAKVHHELASEYYYEGQGMFLEALGFDMLQEAARESRKAIELDPANLEYRHQLVIILHQGMADHAAAVEELEKIAKLDKNPDGFHARRAHEELQHMRSIASVANTLPSEARLAFAAGLAHHRAGRLHEAINNYQAAIVLAPNYVPAYDYGGAVEVGPNIHVVTDQRSHPYMDPGLLQHALRSNSDSLSISLDDDIHLCLGLALIQIGDRKGAVDELRKVIGQSHRDGTVGLVDWGQMLSETVKEVFGPDDGPARHELSRHTQVNAHVQLGLEWPMFGQNPSRSGVAPEIVSPPLRLLWEFPADGFIHSSPVVSNGRVFVGTREGTCYAIDAVTGGKLWEHKVGAMIVASAVVHEGKVYVTTMGGHLHALVAQSGENVWDYRGVPSSKGGISSIFAGARGSHPLIVVARGHAMVWLPGIELAIINSTNGERIGGFGKEGASVSTPAFDSGILYVAISRSIHAFDVASGREVWRVSEADEVRVGPVVGRDMLFYGTKHNALCARNLRDGKLAWKFTIHHEPIHASCEGIESSPTVADDLVHFGGPDGWFYAIDSLSGRERWSFAADSEITASPARSGDQVYFGAMDGTLRCLHANTGVEKWRYNTPSAFQSGPVIVGTRLFCAAKAVYAFTGAYTK